MGISDAFHMMNPLSWRGATGEGGLLDSVATPFGVGGGALKLIKDSLNKAQLALRKEITTRKGYKNLKEYGI